MSGYVVLVDFRLRAGARAAFEAHIQSEHYSRFDAECAGYVLSKSVVVGELVCEGSA